MVVPVVRVADEDFLAGGQGAEDVGATSYLRMTSQILMARFSVMDSITGRLESFRKENRQYSEHSNSPLNNCAAIIVLFKRKGGKLEFPARELPVSGLQSLNVGSLQAFSAAGNLEFDGLSLVKGAVAVRLDSGEMDENVLAALALDEAKALAGVKPLYCTPFFHRSIPFHLKAIWCTLFPEGTFEVNRASFADSNDTAVRWAENKKAAS